MAKASSGITKPDLFTVVMVSLTTIVVAFCICYAIRAVILSAQPSNLPVSFDQPGTSAASPGTTDSKPGLWDTITSAATPQNLADARRRHITQISSYRAQSWPDQPPLDYPHSNDKSPFIQVEYKAPKEWLTAYLSTHPTDTKKRPALIWISGGDCNSIGNIWSGGAEAAGIKSLLDKDIIVMSPTLRGGNMSKQSQESFFGEVDDIIAAHHYLTTLPTVDPSRIYLAGHSTGGTLVLLTSECTDKFRAVFSFGPISCAADYAGGPGTNLVFDPQNSKEADLRAPIKWLHCIKSPTFVIEGMAYNRGNGPELDKLAQAASSSNPIYFVRAQTKDHFSVVQPALKAIGQEILADTGPQCTIRLTDPDLK